MIQWNKQEKIAEDELKDNNKQNFKKKKSRQGVLVRFPVKFYKRLKKEAKFREIPMSKLLNDKLKQCEWIKDYSVLIRKELIQ